MDEADRILSMDFEKEIDKIIKVIPKERTTMMFSATMSEKVGRVMFPYVHTHLHRRLL